MAIMTWKIRRAESQDAGVIADFNSRMAWETERKRLDPQVLDAGVRAVLADPARGWYFVVEEAGEVLGQLMLTFEWSDWRNAWFWWIQSVYIHPNARRRGIFRALYQHVLDLARADGNVVGLRLYVEKDNQAAQQTYTSLGMEQPGYLLMQRYPLDKAASPS